MAAAGLAAVSAAIRSILSARQEQSARKKAQAIKAADEIDSFYDHPAVWLATRIIDYENLTIEKSDVDCLQNSMNSKDVWNFLVYHADVDLMEARKSDGLSSVFGHDERRIRDLFDKFLTKLERIEKLIDNEVIFQADFGDFFSYWLQLMTEVPSPGDRVSHLSDSIRRILWKYIRGYEYRGVVRLFALYDRACPVGVDPDEAFSARSNTVR